MRRAVSGGGGDDSDHVSRGHGGDGGGDSGARWEVVEVFEVMLKAVVTETQRYLNLGTSESYSGEPLSQLPGVGAECLPQENWKELG